MASLWLHDLYYASFYMAFHYNPFIDLIWLTVFTLSIGTPELLTILVLKFEVVHSVDVPNIAVYM